MSAVPLSEAPVPPQSFDDAAFEQQRLLMKFGQYFPSKEQFEYFAMLPLSSDEQRYNILKRVSEIKQEEQKYNIDPHEKNVS